jgi:DNA polymerase V
MMATIASGLSHCVYPSSIKRHFVCVMSSIPGTPCLELDEPNPPKQKICCLRMFGKCLTEIAPIMEAPPAT